MVNNDNDLFEIDEMIEDNTKIEGFNFLWANLRQREADDRELLIKHNQLYNRWQGFIPLVQENHTQVAVINDNDLYKIKQYKALGYKQGKKYNASAIDPQYDNCHYWICDYDPQAAYMKGALTGLNTTAGGINLATGYSKQSLSGIEDKKILSYVTRVIYHNNNTPLIPIWDSKMNRIVAYERTPDKETYDLFSYNEDLADLIGHWKGRQLAEKQVEEGTGQLIQGMYDLWQSDDLYRDADMSKYCTFRAGGRAKELYVVSSVKGLRSVLDICNQNGRKPLVIGNGSNLLVSDKGIDIPVVMGNKGCYCIC